VGAEHLLFPSDCLRWEQASAISKYTSLAVHNRSRELTAETKVIALSSAGGPRACVLRRTFFEGTAFIDYRLRGYCSIYPFPGFSL
jgi:hypothetical protein